MKSVNQNPDHRARIGYNGFPLSHKLKFSSTVGELLPVFFDVAMPGDKYSLSYELYTRSNPLLKPAWFSMFEKIDWFFVPTTQIYQFFGEFYYGIQDMKTSLATPANFNAGSFPHLDATTNQLRAFMQALQSDTDGYNFDLVGTKCRVAELLGIPVADTISVVSGAQLFHGVSALIPAAYQKIFMDYYRDSDREPNDPSYYNLDKYYQTNVLSGVDYAHLFKMRYHRWKPDLFTHVFNSPLWGSNSNDSANLGLGFTNNLLNSLSDWLLPQGTRVAGTSNNLDNVTLGPDGDQASIFPTALSGRVFTNDWTNSTQVYRANLVRQLAASTSPQSLRHSFALEKLLEITRRAGKHYDAQTLAHFGVEVPTGIAGEVLFLGSSSAKMEVRDVVATAMTPSSGQIEGVALGQQAGKAFTAGHGSKIKFSAPSDGVIMGIYCAIPEIDWQGGLDRLHSYTTRDTWFSEEFDNSGMQPLFKYQIEYNTLANSSNNNIQGYQYPFAERKIKYNRVCGALRRTFRDWTPQKTEMGTAYYDFYVDPHYLDNVFALPYAFNVINSQGDDVSAIVTLSHVDDDPDSPTYGQTIIDGYNDLTYDRDPFQHFIEFHCNKSSKMSVFGLPNL